MVDTQIIKEKIREEIRQLFNETYCGHSLPTLNNEKLDFWVEKALNYYDRELFYNKVIK